MKYKVKKDWNYKNKGYSLLELMVVVVIIGIIMSITIPQISNTIDNINRDRGVWHIVKGFSFAVSNGIYQARAFRITLSTQNGGWMRVDRGVGDSCNRLPVNCPDDPLINCGVYIVDFSDTLKNSYPTRVITSATYAQSRIQITGLFVGNQQFQNLELCWNPRGRLMLRQGNQWVNLLAPIEINIQRLDFTQGVPTSTIRRIVVPQNGIPRIFI